MNGKTFFLSLVSVGIMLLNNTATARADWNQSGIGMNAYSGQIMLGSLDRHNLADFKRIDPASSGGDALFGSSSVQAPVTLVAGGAAIEIKIMNAAQVVDDYTVNGKECSPDKAFHAFVSPIATCSAVYGRNFSGFRAVAEKLTGTEWRPMLYMNANGRWVDMSVDDNIGSVSDVNECRKLLVQKVCQ